MQQPAVKIDDAINSILGPLSDSEQAELEADVLANGVHTPLVVWRTGDVLLDGHNRYNICKRHGLDYPVRYVELPDRDAALEFVENTQLARRNLTPERYAYIRGRKYNRIKGKRGGDQAKYQSDTSGGDVAEQMAQRLGVGRATVIRDAEYADAVDEIGKHDPKAKAAILDRKAKVTRAAVKEAAKAEPKERAEFAKAVVKDAESKGKAPRRQAAPRPKPRAKPSKAEPTIHDVALDPGKNFAVIIDGYRIVIHLESCCDSGARLVIEAPPAASILTVQP